MFMLSDCVSVLLLHNADTAVNVRKNAKLIKSGWHSLMWKSCPFYFVPSKMSFQSKREAICKTPPASWSPSDFSVTRRLLSTHCSPGYLKHTDVLASSDSLQLLQSAAGRLQISTSKIEKHYSSTSIDILYACQILNWLKRSSASTLPLSLVDPRRTASNCGLHRTVKCSFLNDANLNTCFQLVVALVYLMALDI